ncbi:hypothetical protein [Absidia glauca]|uniref:Uncharacterized protein n=1 Tax=Absidia glauca TaxID=4829 RepID=A0A163KFV9_ABSGL|nr:hypothetical protein [Absidia glauca]
MTDENDDFQEMVEPSGRKHARLQSTQLEISTRCSLCTALWSNRGPHRIVSLMCGHTFGEKDAIRRPHLRPIWPNKIIHDNDSILKLKLELEQAQATLEDILRQLDNTNSQYLQCCSALREIPDDHPVPSQDPPQPPQKTLPPPLLDAPDASFQLVDTMMLSNERQVARVMTVVPDEEMVVATMKKGTQSHGLYKLSLRDLRSSEYLGNHTGLVRDVKSSVNVIDNGNVTLLSTGLDKTLKLTSASNNCTVLS